MSRSAHLAVDLGAESGRVVLGVLQEGRLTLDVVHRFPHRPVLLPSGLHWDLTGIWGQVLEGLRGGVARAREIGLSPLSVGVDSWGVDFGLIGESGTLLGLPLAYRDERLPRAFERVVSRVGRPAIYAATGIQFMPLNTLYQLELLQESAPELLRAAQRLLFVPDLLHYFLSGVPSNEATIASTSQMIDAHGGGWALGLLERAGVPVHLLHPTTPPGRVLGALRAPVRAEIGADAGAAIRVVTPTAHDTAAAVAAVPAEGDDWAYLSSGTWSLLGAEIAAPRITDAARDAGFTNERGAAGTIRFLKNITGLWLVQECRAALRRAGQDWDYAALSSAAERAPGLRTLVDPNWAPLSQPGSMPEKIAEYARRSGQPVPTTPGELVRCCLDSLALTYRRVLRSLQELLGRRVGVLHVVGGGGQNALLNQLTADAVGIPLRVGPSEATAAGNLLAQALGCGLLEDWSAVRRVVRGSFAPLPVEPASGTSEAWASAEQRLERYRGLLA